MIKYTNLKNTGAILIINSKINKENLQEPKTKKLEEEKCLTKPNEGSNYELQCNSYLKILKDIIFI